MAPRPAAMAAVVFGLLLIAAGPANALTGGSALGRKLLGADAATAADSNPARPDSAWRKANTHGSDVGTRSVAGYGGASASRFVVGWGGHRRSLAGADAVTAADSNPARPDSAWRKANTHGSDVGTRSVAGYGGASASRFVVGSGP